jgi:tRNA(adenine34) deaminase
MNDLEYMQLALQEAEMAAERGEVPVGAVLVDADGIIVCQDGNRSIENNDPTGHAEIVVLRQAGQHFGNYRLSGSTLYVTIEPCAMCAGAIIHARVSRLVFGAPDPKTGAIQSCYQIGSDRKLNHTLEVTGGVLQEKSSELLRSFFRDRRTK